MTDSMSDQIKVKETSPFFIYLIFIIMDLSKIINKVLLESDGVEEFYGVEEYTKDIQMEQEIKKLANTLRPFIQRVARESMYVVDRNKKEIRNILFDFIQTYLENDSNEGPIDTQVESIKTEEQDHYPVDFNRENKFRLIIFLLNLFSNYINDYEGGNMNNEKMIRKNKELIRMDLIHFIQIYLEESDDINESNIDMNIESIIRKVLIEEFIQVNEFLYEDIHGSVEEVNLLQEAEYQGRKVQLGKIMQGDIKKFKVYVKNDKGKVVKVNFGFGGKSAKGKRMVIKKNNPERRRSFRARHNCDNPGPRWKPRYWACRTW
jgi:tRNA splicing endonuclease